MFSRFFFSKHWHIHTIRFTHSFILFEMVLFLLTFMTRNGKNVNAHTAHIIKCTSIVRPNTNMSLFFWERVQKSNGCYIRYIFLLFAVSLSFATNFIRFMMVFSLVLIFLWWKWFEYVSFRFWRKKLVFFRESSKKFLFNKQNLNKLQNYLQLRLNYLYFKACGALEEVQLNGIPFWFISMGFFSCSSTHPHPLNLFNFPFLHI